MAKQISEAQEVTPVFIEVQTDAFFFLNLRIVSNINHITPISCNLQEIYWHTHGQMNNILISNKSYFFTLHIMKFGVLVFLGMSSCALCSKTIKIARFSLRMEK